MKKDKILVTGATGFIGKAVIRILSANDIPFISHKELNIDVTAPDTFNFSGKDEVSHVIHLAGKTFVPDSWNNPSEYYRVNALGTMNVAEFCRKINARLIYISAYIYGNTQNNPINEDHPANVNNPYAFSKRAGEDICLFYNRTFELPVAIIRPFNVYGPGQDKNFIIPEVINQAKAGNKIHVRDLQPKRDYIYVDDVASIILNLIRSGKEGIFNAGTGKSHSVKELLEVIQKVMQTKLPVTSDQVSRVNEISDTIADISKAKKELNWSPDFTLEEGIRKIVEQS